MTSKQKDAIFYYVKALGLEISRMIEVQDSGNVFVEFVDGVFPEGFDKDGNRPLDFNEYYDIAEGTE